MKARIIITDDQGRTFEGEAELFGTSKVSGAARPKKVAPRGVTPRSMDFSLNPLAFMRRYARALQGPQKFTVLVARLAKGRVSDGVPFAEVKKHWNKMKGVLGKFNPAYANRAKANGWVDPSKHGVCALSSSWKEVLK